MKFFKVGLTFIIGQNSVKWTEVSWCTVCCMNNQFDNYYRCHQNHKSIQRVLEQHIKSFIPFITGPLWGQNHFICAFEFWNSDNLKKSLLAVLFRQIWIHWKELMNISSHFGNFYLIQLIDQPILRIQSFKFPNLRCCIVSLFFCV